ncbi:unnamed protein product [Closterium sp. NIES-64]|nr:unnamed protein product [Closterium sp. NIES-64]
MEASRNRGFQSNLLEFPAAPTSSASTAAALRSPPSLSTCLPPFPSLSSLSPAVPKCPQMWAVVVVRRGRNDGGKGVEDETSGGKEMGRGVEGKGREGGGMEGGGMEGGGMEGGGMEGGGMEGGGMEGGGMEGGGMEGGGMEGGGMEGGGTEGGGEWVVVAAGDGGAACCWVMDKYRRSPLARYHLPPACYRSQPFLSPSHLPGCCRPCPDTTSPRPATGATPSTKSSPWLLCRTGLDGFWGAPTAVLLLFGEST